jgi:hypothetical protein
MKEALAAWIEAVELCSTGQPGAAVPTFFFGGAIVTGITEGIDRNGNWLQRWQDGGSQYGDHAV